MPHNLGSFWSEVMDYRDKIEQEYNCLVHAGQVSLSREGKTEAEVALEILKENSRQKPLTAYLAYWGLTNFNDYEAALFSDRLKDGRWNPCAIGDVTILPTDYSLNSLFRLDGWKPRKVDEFSTFAYFNNKLFYKPVLLERKKQERERFLASLDLD